MGHVPSGTWERLICGNDKEGCVIVEMGSAKVSDLRKQPVA
jgi:hypothetical protein